MIHTTAKKISSEKVRGGARKKILSERGLEPQDSLLMLKLKYVLHNHDLLEIPQIIRNLLRTCHDSDIIQDPPVDDVAEHGANNLSEECDDAAAQPLVARLEVEHFVQEQEDDTKRDIVIRLARESKNVSDNAEERDRA